MTAKREYKASLFLRERQISNVPLISVWQSSGKVKEFYCVLLWLDALRGLGILVSVRFDFS
jgi:hypothetical protein